MYLSECCITELFDKPGLVQVTGVCSVCCQQVMMTIVQKTLESCVERGSFEGTAINDQNQEFLKNGICCECQSKETDAV